MENKGAGQEPMEEDHGRRQDPLRVVVSAKKKMKQTKYLAQFGVG
jgi:hypothetical protein